MIPTMSKYCNVFIPRHTLYFNKDISNIRFFNSTNSLYPIFTTILQPFFRHSRGILISSNKNNYSTKFKEDDIKKFDEEIEKIEREFSNSDNDTKDNTINTSPINLRENTCGPDTQRQDYKTNCKPILYQDYLNNESNKNNRCKVFYDKIHSTSTSKEFKHHGLNNSETMQEFTEFKNIYEKQKRIKNDSFTSELLYKRLQHLKNQFWKIKKTKDHSFTPYILKYRLQNIRYQFWQSNESEKQKKHHMKIKELQSELLRSYAVQENIRQSLKADADSTRSVSITNFARNIIHISDNLTSAIESIPVESRKNDIISNIYQGLKMMDISLMKAFDKEGLTKLGIVGETLDCKKHIVLGRPTHTNEVGALVQYVKKVGFALNGKVLRKAEVLIKNNKVDDKLSENE